MKETIVDNNTKLSGSESRAFGDHLIYYVEWAYLRDIETELGIDETPGSSTNPHHVNFFYIDIF
jgi:hypothetical protein